MRLGILRGVMASPARLAVIPMTDWLGLGTEARINTPGRADGNWQWRAAQGVFTTALAAEIRAMSVRFFRAEPLKPAKDTAPAKDAAPEEKDAKKTQSVPAAAEEATARKGEKNSAHSVKK